MMKKRKWTTKTLHSPAYLRLLCMIGGGGVSILVSNTWDRPFYVEGPVGEAFQAKEESGILLEALAVGEAFWEESQEAAQKETRAREVYLDGIGDKTDDGLVTGDLSRRLNFAFYYDEGADRETSQSYAEKAYQELLNKDGSWLSGIYGLRHVSPETMAARLGRDKSTVTGVRHLNGVPLEGKENQKAIPSWNRFNVTFQDGDGKVIMGHSNIKEILSIANVYAYFNQEQSWDFLLSCTQALWDSSHSYKISVSDVYYCQGECQYSEEEEESWEDDSLGAESGMIFPESAQAIPGSAPALQSQEAEQSQTEESGQDAANSQGAANTSGQISHPPIPAAAQTDGQTSPENNPVSPEPSGTATDGGGSGQGGSLASPDGAAVTSSGDSVLPESSGQGFPEPVAAPMQGETAGAGNDLFPEEAAFALGDENSTGSLTPRKQESEETLPSGEGSSQVPSESFPSGQADGDSPRETDVLASAPSGSQGDGDAGLESGETSPDPMLLPAAESSPSSQGWEAAPSQGSGASSGQNVDNTASKNKYCCGHIDLNVSAVIVTMDGRNNLFAQFPQNFARAQSQDTSTWNGWDETAMECAKAISQQDWYAEYGLSSRNAIFVQNPLSGSEVDAYMNLLPAGTSQKRRTVVRQALLSIGCIPYYWGGKPSGGGFEKNGFGTVVSPDEDGRILKGLDCSGWINWVYWTAFGSSLPAQSTSSLMGCGRAVEKQDLQAGDILIRAGSQPHVYLFLAWAGDGSMYLIHETTGNANNVIIGTYDLDLPYYRCLINEE